MSRQATYYRDSIPQHRIATRATNPIVQVEYMNDKGVLSSLSFNLIDSDSKHKLNKLMIWACRNGIELRVRPSKD